MADALPLPPEGGLLVASRRGRLHAHRGAHREDAAAWRVTPAGWCVAVADGAGSAAYSRVGAALATQRAVATVAAALAVAGTTPAEALAQGATAAQTALAALAEHAPCAPRDLRTTLLVAAGAGDQVAVMQVGDGAIVCAAPQGGFTQPLAGHAGDFSGEVTHFLPDPGAAEALAASITALPVGGVAALLLATDGVEDPWYPLARSAPALLASLAGATPAPGTLPDGLLLRTVAAPAGGILAAPDPAPRLLEWMGFEKRGENDDRTLALVRLPGFRAWPASAAR